MIVAECASISQLITLFVEFIDKKLIFVFFFLYVINSQEMGVAPFIYVVR